MALTIGIVGLPNAGKSTFFKAKEAGKVRMEGKDYVMQDGDVVEFRHGGQSGSGKK